jgi:hypothetical protein
MVSHTLPRRSAPASARKAADSRADSRSWLDWLAVYGHKAKKRFKSGAAFLIIRGSGRIMFGRVMCGKYAKRKVIGETRAATGVERGAYVITGTAVVGNAHAGRVGMGRYRFENGRDLFRVAFMMAFHVAALSVGGGAGRSHRPAPSVGSGGRGIAKRAQVLDQR